MATAQQQQTTSILDSLQRDASSEKLKDLSAKSEALKKANQAYLEDLKSGTERVLKGQQREESEKSKLEQSLNDCNAFKSTVADTVILVTNEFSAVDQYLEDIKVYVGKERFAKFVSEKWAQSLKDKRVLNTSLSQNLKSILNYYSDMRDVMYSSAVDIQKAVNAIRDTSAYTLSKLNDNETNYNEWQQKRTGLEAQLSAVDKELMTLTGKKRAEKEQERDSIRNQLHDAQNKENDYFSIVDNARKDLKYQEENLEQYENVVGGLSVSIRDMEQKVENRTVLFEKIEDLVKTAHRVRAAGYADAAMNKTMAGIAKTAVSTAEGILDSLGKRKKAIPMTPEEFQELRQRGRKAKEEWETIQRESKEAYAKPGEID